MKQTYRMPATQFFTQERRALEEMAKLEQDLLAAGWVRTGTDSFTLSAPEKEDESET